MGIEEKKKDDESDWERKEEPALTSVGDKTPALEAEVGDTSRGWNHFTWFSNLQASCYKGI